MPSIPHFLEVVLQTTVTLSALRAGSSLMPERFSSTYFCQIMSPSQCDSAAARIKSIEETQFG
jgi:hypothetical protein